MAFKINNSHWDVIVDFMEKHPDLARGKFAGPSGREQHKKLWQQLTNTLNALGLGERSVEKWQKIWCDLKYSIKKRAAQMNVDQKCTGGGPSTSRDLTKYELRVLDILGNTFHQGVGSKECGVPVNQETTAILESSYITDVETDGELADPTYEENLPLNEKTNVSTAPTVQKVSMDHNYGLSRKRKKRTQEQKEHDIFLESLKEMKEINQNLSRLTNTLSDIKDVLLNFLCHQK